MTRHYVMTAAYRGPDYPLDANARRIDLTRRITARSLAAQAGDWSWIVYVHPADPLRDERMAAFAEAGHPIIPVEHNGEAEAAIDWSGPVLTTRIDDDDAFAYHSFDRLRVCAAEMRQPTALIFPTGYHVRDGRVEMHRHYSNAWASVYSPPGFRQHVRLHQHQRIAGAYPVVYLGDAPAWLRVSHRDNNHPTSHRPHGRITPAVRALFPVDWSLLERQAVAA